MSISVSFSAAGLPTKRGFKTKERRATREALEKANRVTHLRRNYLKQIGQIPVDTGYLASSFYIDAILMKDNGVKVTLGFSAPYALYQDQGTDNIAKKEFLAALEAYWRKEFTHAHRDFRRALDLTGWITL